MRFAVCDDEKGIRDGISDKIKLFSPGSLITEFSSGKELLESKDIFDIIFLDIAMDEIDGMQTAKELRARGCSSVIVFVTAYDDRVFEAFDVGAFHFLVKPVSAVKFIEVLKKAIESCTEPPEAVVNDRYITVKSGGVSTRLALSEIIYAEISDRTMMLHTVSGNFKYRGKISEFENNTGDGFFRTHRSYIINLRYLESYTSSYVSMENGDRVVLAKHRYADLVKAYMRFIKSEDINALS